MALRSILDGQQVSSYEFKPPGPNDIRGPYPGLNTAANHGYINHNGITNFDELVKMQIELYNFDIGLATLLATVGVALDGDVITGGLSIRNKSSSVPGIFNTPLGLNAHNTFEDDTFLTRNDYYLANGNNYDFNGTLYRMMHNISLQNNGSYNRQAMLTYRYLRYQQSLNENGQFFFGPLALLLYGAASFLYEGFGHGTDIPPTEPIVSSFFDAHSDGKGNWIFTPERIPLGWFKRKTPYTLIDINREILSLYLAHPVLFGGNTGKPNSFVIGSVQLPPDQHTVDGIGCFIYQALLAFILTEIQSPVTTILSILNFLTTKLDPIYGAQFKCPSTSFPSIQNMSLTTQSTN